MTTQPTHNDSNSERPANVRSGWGMLAFNLILLFGAWAFVIGAVMENDPALLIGFVPFELLAIIFLFGHFTLQPNTARVLVLFGEYNGTIRQSGFYWANPFYSRSRGGNAFNITVQQKSAHEAPTVAAAPSFKISLRARNLNTGTIKVNDKRGNPVEIGAVVVWRVNDTAQACFDVDDFENYVRVQSESAVRHVASAYAYDHGEVNEPTLRASAEVVAEALRLELQARLDKAGVKVDEARLTHLAYAPEIAQAMLRRQQAEAVIAARQMIVHGAVSMVDMALKELASKEIVHLDDERKAAMVSNLLVVLCGETEAKPVINTGTIYH